MIIGLTGKKGSGKDSVASALIEDHGFVRVAFADPLKQSVSALLGIDRDTIEELKNNEYARVIVMDAGGFDREQRLHGSQSFREFLQRFGTEAHRDVFGDEFWLDAARQRIISLGKDGYDLIVLTDVRFENEATLVRQLGGKIVEVHRPGINHPDNHPSEQTPVADMILFNSGTLADLRVEASNLYNHLDGFTS
jgi:hypothetical protein